MRVLLATLGVAQVADRQFDYHYSIVGPKVAENIHNSCKAIHAFPKKRVKFPGGYAG